VNEIEGLRVADASIMPQLISSNTNISCVVSGEKASNLIKAEYVTEINEPKTDKREEL